MNLKRTVLTMDRLTPEEMILAIKNNYPESSRFVLLCKTLDYAVELLQAESEGRLIVLPANWKELYDLRGDTVWVLWNGDPNIERSCPDGLEDLWEGVCCDVYIDEEGRARICFALHDYTDENGPLPFDVYASHYGESIFRTKEEAEAALGRSKPNGD